MVSKPDYSKTAAALVGGHPLAFKSYPDGSLNVIAPNGQKFCFTPAQVEEQLAKLNKPVEPTPKPAPKATKPPRKPTNKK